MRLLLMLLATLAVSGYAAASIAESESNVDREMESLVAAVKRSMRMESESAEIPQRSRRSLMLCLGTIFHKCLTNVFSNKSIISV
jgi:hypothetical protein